MKFIIRHKIYLMISLFGILMIWSCNLNNESDSINEVFYNYNKLPIVTGQILNLNKDEVENIKIRYSIVTPFGGYKFQNSKTIDLEKDGSFRLKLDYKIPYQQIWLTIGELAYLKIYALNDVNITFDADILRDNYTYWSGKGIEFSGSDSDLNHILNEHIKYKHTIRRSINDSINNLIENSSNGLTKPILKKYNKFYQRLNSIDEEFSNLISSSYNWLIKNEKLSDYYYGILYMNHKSKIHDSLFSKIKEHSSMVSNNGSDFYSELFYYLYDKSGANNEIKDYSIFKTYSKLTQHDKKIMEEILHENGEKSHEVSYDSLKYKNLIKELKRTLQDTLLIWRANKFLKYIDNRINVEQADRLKLQLINGSQVLQQEQKLITILKETVKTPWVYDLLQKDFEITKGKIENVNSSLKNTPKENVKSNIGRFLMKTRYGAELYEINDSIEAKQFLSNLKSNYKNKAMLIDFWATWCGPCKTEMPFSKSLKSKLKNDPIEFIYLCTSLGTDKETWIENINEFKLQGVHIFVDERVLNDLMNIFSASGFPSYRFISKKGEYIPGSIKNMHSLKKPDILELIEE